MLAAPARRRAACASASWTPRPAWAGRPPTTSTKRALHHDSQADTSERGSQQPTSISSNTPSSSSSYTRRRPVWRDIPAYNADPSSSYPSPAPPPPPRQPQPSSSTSTSTSTTSETSNAHLNRGKTGTPNCKSAVYLKFASLPVDQLRHSRGLKIHKGAHRAIVLVEESKDVIDAFVIGRLKEERLSPSRALAEVTELLPEDVGQEQAALLLISSLTTGDRATSENLAFARALYMLQRDEARAKQTASAPVRHLARVVRPSFDRVVSSVAYAALAAEIVQDRRLKPAERRSLVARAMPGLCHLLRTLSQTGHGRHTREIRRNHLYEVWREAIESLLIEGVLSPASGHGAGSSSQAAALCAQMLMMAVRWGPSFSAVRLAESLHSVNSLEQVIKGATASSSRVDVDNLSSLPVTEQLVHGLISRGAAQHAGSIFMMLPHTLRSFDGYVALLEHLGESDASIPLDSRYKRAMPPRPPSIMFQRVLWEDALAHVRQSDGKEHVARLKRLFGARMVSHARHGSANMVEQDLGHMQMVGLLGDGSDLSSKAQVAIVRAFIRAGRWDEAKERAIQMLAQRRQDANHELAVARQGAAMLNTLIAGVVSQDIEAAGLPAEHRSEQDDDEGANVPAGRGLLDQVLSEVSLPIGTLVQVLRCHDSLVEELNVVPDAVTRNILLGFLFRWRLAPLGDDISTIRQLLKRCGVFGGKKGGGKKGGAERLQEAREFMAHGKSVLRAIIKTLYEQGHVDHAQWVVGMLKEAELAAQTELRKGGAHSERGTQENKRAAPA